MRTKDPGFLKDTVMASFPAGPVGAAELVATSNYGIFTNCKFPKEAGLMIAGTLAPDRYIGALKTGGSYYFPVMKTYASDKFFTDDPWNKQIAESLKVGKSAYADGGPAAWVDEVGTRFLWSEFLMRIVVDGMAPAKSAEKFQADCVETKKKYDAKK
jgi:ABC-type glycerol-3-phosphate transport system substrate-binding protein